MLGQILSFMDTNLLIYTRFPLIHSPSPLPARCEVTNGMPSSTIPCFMPYRKGTSVVVRLIAKQNFQFQFQISSNLLSSMIFLWIVILLLPRGSR